jgi:hypothetical protein
VNEGEMVPGSGKRVLGGDVENPVVVKFVLEGLDNSVACRREALEMLAELFAEFEGVVHLFALQGLLQFISRFLDVILVLVDVEVLEKIDKTHFVFKLHLMNGRGCLETLQFNSITWNVSLLN